MSYKVNSFKKLIDNYFEMVLLLVILLVLGFHIYDQIHEANERVTGRLIKAIETSRMVVPDQFINNAVKDNAVRNEDVQKFNQRLDSLVQAFAIDKIIFVAEQDNSFFRVLASTIVDPDKESESVLSDTDRFSQTFPNAPEKNEAGNVEIFEFLDKNTHGLFSIYVTDQGNRFAIAAEYYADNDVQEIIEEIKELYLILILFPLLFFGQAYMTKSKLLISEKGLRDELTGLYNRKILTNIRERYHTYPGINVELYYFDLDGLKVVNDTQGHDAGDKLIADFVKIINKSFRDSDRKIRLGGDEFMVVTEVGENSLMETRLKRLAANAKHSHVSYSLGTVCFVTDPSLDLDRQIKRADELMYEQKEQKKAAKAMAADKDNGQV